MKSKWIGAACGAVLLGFGFAPSWSSAQTVITKWDFGVTGVQSAPYNAPAPSTGIGTAITLGMTNSYNGGNTASDDILSTAGVATPVLTENTWRIRGAQTNGTPAGHNGWATFQSGAGAPQYSQGIELDASTVGFQNIQFSFDWFSTNQGIRDLQFQYNLNVSNANGWTNFGGTSPTGTYIAVPNDFYSTNSPNIAVDLSSISGANNDANFGVRLVSAFDSTGHVANDYAGATLAAGLTTIYNNSSGNWRLDNLTFSGTAVVAPEPGSMALLGIGAAGLLARRRRSLA
jgi:hypothetical protein